MPIATHMIQPDMLEMRIERPEATAMAPSEIDDTDHSQIASAPVETIRMPLRHETVAFIAVMSRVSLRKVSVCSFRISCA